MSREIHIHVEEPSMAAFLQEFLPRHLDPAVTWKPIDYGSKPRLLTELPKRLHGYAKYAAEYRPRVLVLVDRDSEDCIKLKQRLESYCGDAGLATISNRTASGDFDVVNRIVIEELEAWFFGDFTALDAGWPGMARHAKTARYREPDGIIGGTHEALLRAFQSARHLQGLNRLPKIETARTMAQHMAPDRNQSPSFKQFWRGLNDLLATA